MRESSKPWRPFTANCCSVEDQTFLGNFSRCRTSKSDVSKNIAPLPSFRRLSFSDLSRSSSTRINEDLAQSFGPDLFDFQLSELRAITHNFSSDFLLGEGGFGTVHKGYVDDNLRQGLKAQAVAVKLLDIEGLQGHREWLVLILTNLDFLLNVTLFMDGLSVTLPWGTRLKIATGAAKGLAFLHGAEKPVIYRDFKTSNVLLDSDFTAKLSDFGLAKMGPEGSETHVTTRVMGTYGYAAPEYVSTGHLTTQSDVYSFGVVLLELLTGRRATDRSRPKSEQNIINWAKPYLTSSRRLRCIMDPRLAGQYSVKGAKHMALLALQCISLNPRDRPKMPSIVETLEGFQHYKDMAVACGQWQASSKPTARNGVSPRGRLESRGASYRKSAPVASRKRN
ncbi:SERINE/THREONINE-PROTEIN KINASE ACTIVE SITE PROTEIN-RELATED [Salix purpurea]|uniref:SERINE/THREONINE-PROTEIN KINASE ACTIVE SITE PROTEIN-RELATED n=1 Tax=Salix purpurea TaxID=77065 RepID=A0A9Q0QFR5_SALPP|nr:SERINE/THREONINE-PROTEIN KINASE ACTIVE SITE PROTEIN-RELATED [Salix purpurea]